MIRLKGIIKNYIMGENIVNVLKNIDLNIEANEFVSIFGPSGSGKSTIMNIIGCLDVATEGSYELDGREVSNLSDDELAEIRNEKIGFVFQKYNLLPKLSALENVGLPLIYQGLDAKTITERSMEVLKKVGMEHRMHHRPNELSGGQQQRVAIARALITNPPVILADEPTGALDSKTGLEVIEILTKLHIQGSTVILITHDMDLAKHAKRVIKIQDGTIIEDKELI